MYLFLLRDTFHLTITFALAMKILHLALIVFFLTSFCSCKKEEVTSMRSAKAGKKFGGRYTLNEIRGNPSSLDPVRINSKLEDDIAVNIFDRLVDNDYKLDLVPELAKSWEISADGRTYTFHLRNDGYEESGIKVALANKTLHNSNKL